MRVAGVIAEYNPFHSGHEWQLRQTRARTGCDYVVACMAGHFTQRGEPAALSKWARARM
ncbi:MAG: nucleotidyltransferase family protein, partial [Clostridia bacterium]|nr:nucleotidyltransferase family protein [Clostridia bacterium]